MIFASSATLLFDNLDNLDFSSPFSLEVLTVLTLIFTPLSRDLENSRLLTSTFYLFISYVSVQLVSSFLISQRRCFGYFDSGGQQGKLRQF